MADNKPELQRGLEARHIELIALGGTIGVGLFMGAASTLKWAGPSVLLAYIIAGLFVFFIMRSMGEMLFLEPVTGSFAVYAHRYMSPFFGYLTAWSYWFMWMAVGISEITAIGVYVQFWFPEMAQWIPALIAVALVALANLAAVRLYGEIEFWFAMIKVTTIIVMIVIGLGVIFFGFGNGGQSIGFSNLTEHGGFFAGGWKGFLTALCIVVASYQGVELIGITAGEAKNPQVTLRSAVGKVLWRILIFYVGAIFVIVTIFPWNEIGSNGSPFVLTFAKIGRVQPIVFAIITVKNILMTTVRQIISWPGYWSIRRMKLTRARPTPQSTPTRSSFHTTFIISDGSTSPTAIPRIIIVLAWLPEFPPVSISMGTNVTSSGMAANAFSYFRRIPPVTMLLTIRIISQGRRFFAN